MTHSEFILPGVVSNNGTTGTATIVGSSTPWHDDDDATLVVLQTDWTGDETTSSVASVTAPMIGYSGTTTSSTTVLVHLRCYCQVLTGGGSPPPDAKLDVWLYDPATFSPLVRVGDLAAPSGSPRGFEWSIPASTSGIPMVDYTIDLSDTLGGSGDHFTEYGTTKAAMLVFLAGVSAIQADIDFYNTDPVTKWEVGIAKLWLEITELEDVAGGLIGSAPPSQLISPLRQYPRTDGLGASSAPRLWPPPRSVQASNRRAGGYL